MDDEKKEEEKKPRKDCIFEIPCAGMEIEGKPIEEG